MARTKPRPVFLRTRRGGPLAALLVRVVPVVLAAGPFGFAGWTGGPALAQDANAPTRIDRSGAGADTSARRPTVRVEELGAPGSGSTGTLGDGSGGLGAGLWRGAAADEVAALIDRLPAAHRSPVLHDLQRRLLLSIALAPSGEAQAGEAQAGFVRARLAALLRMGAIRDTAALAARTRAKPEAPFPAIRAHFLAGDGKKACAAVATVPGSTAPFIEQARIACHVLNGHGERAEIALRLLHDQGAPPPAPFENAVLAVAAGRAPGRLAKPYPLTLTLLSRHRMGVKPAELKRLSTGTLIALGANAEALRRVRIGALEQAAARGAPVGRELAALYAGVRLPAKDIADAASVRLRDFDARARLRLYLAAAAAKDVPRRLRILAAWWRLAAAAAARGDDGAEILAAQQTVPLLGGIEPAPAHQDHAAHIARACFATGRTGQALAWYRYLKQAPFRNPADLHRLTALAALATPTSEDSIDSVATWIRYKRWRTAKTAAAPIADLKALLEGLGRIDDFPLLSDGSDVGETTAGDSAIGETAASRSVAARRDPALLAVAAAGQRGLTVLRVLTLVNGRSLRRLSRRLLRDAVFGLRAVGLDEEARRLAVEAALVRQL
ncbi:MAG: hypothetical protein OXF89_05885 [Rhodospirillaceae bacterium]|nr:hypothetical protein [Rhodospirillaceae bacterium]